MQETQEMRVWSLGGEDPLEEGVAAHSISLVWRIPLDRGACRATVMGSQSWTRLKWLSRQACCRWKHRIHFRLDSFQRHKEEHLQEQRAPSNYDCLLFLWQWRDFRLWASKGREGGWEGLYTFNYKTNQNLLNILKIHVCLFIFYWCIVGLLYYINFNCMT